MFFFLPTDAALFPLRYNYYRYVPSRRLLCHEHQAYVDARLSHSMVNLPLIDDDYGDWPMLGDAPHSAILRCWSMFIHCLNHYNYIYISLSLSLVSTTWRHSSTKAVDIWPQQWGLYLKVPWFHDVLAPWPRPHTTIYPMIDPLKHLTTHYFLMAIFTNPNLPAGNSTQLWKHTVFNR